MEMSKELPETAVDRKYMVAKQKSLTK